MGKILEITKELRNQYKNIDFDDYRHNKSNCKLYRGKCISCLKDRGYISSRSRWISLCRSCNGIMSGLTNQKGKTPHNKNKRATIEQRIKQSCSHRKIHREEFDKFLHEDKKRHEFNNSGLREQCFLNADYTCDITKEKGVELNAHHLESWHSNEELRYDINNLICISKEMHDEFHRIYGRKNNTKQQYEEFKNNKLFV
jgi:hypothetical protein